MRTDALPALRPALPARTEDIGGGLRLAGAAERCPWLQTLALRPWVRLEPVAEPVSDILEPAAPSGDLHGAPGAASSALGD